MPPAKRKRGRPEHIVTDDMRLKVRIMSSLGLPQDDQCRILQISVPTLTKFYAEELRIGGLEATMKVAASLYATALKGGREGTSAAIFWLKSRAGWRDDGQQPQQDRPAAEAKLGKKEERALAAANPDQATTIGQLMAMRNRMRTH